MIPCASPKAQYLAYQEGLDEAIHGVLGRGQYIMGAELAAFEEEFGRFIETEHVVGVGSGTDALRLALEACGVERGDEVVTVSHTAVATVAAIEQIGARPVLVDVESEYYTMAPRELERAISPRTKAIVPVHLYGQAADIDAICAIARERGLRVVEDCAQAHGARFGGRRLGTLGDAGCFSFYPTKNLGALGDGGAVVTTNPEVAQRVRQLREYGWEDRFVSSLPGWNSRLDELQAAILRVKLRGLNGDNVRRALIAERYDGVLKEVGTPHPLVRPGAEHVYHLYVIRSQSRSSHMASLRSLGVQTSIHYPIPVHQQPAYRQRLQIIGNLANSEAAAREVISLPIYPELTDSQVAEVCRAIRTVFR